MYYDLNRTKHRQNVTTRKWEVIRENQQRVLEHFAANTCVDCGEKDVIVLEFDHVRGEKRGNVSEILKAGSCWQTIEAEIQKCDVRCANCHRRKTYRECESYRVAK